MEAIELVIFRREAVRQHHAELLSPRQRQVLLLEFFGLETIEIAGLFGTSQQTVKNQAHIAHTAVVRPPLPTTRANATLWTMLHADCCMAAAFAMLEI